MRIGKVKESILKRSVLRQLHNHSEEGSLASGEDAGVLFYAGIFRGCRGGIIGESDRRLDICGKESCLWRCK